MELTLRQWAATETYSDVAPLIYATCKTFHERYGGNLDDMIAEGNAAFMKCFDTFNLSKARFSTYLYYSIQKRFLEQIRNQSFYPTNRNKGLTKHEPITQARSYCFLTDLIDGLTDDARTVVQLALETPMELRAALVTRRSAAPQSVRAAIAEVLTDWGWATDRITETFSEIGRALQ